MEYTEHVNIWYQPKTGFIWYLRYWISCTVVTLVLPCENSSNVDIPYPDLVLDVCCRDRIILQMYPGLRLDFYLGGKHPSRPRYFIHNPLLYAARTTAVSVPFFESQSLLQRFCASLLPLNPVHKFLQLIFYIPLFAFQLIRRCKIVCFFFLKEELCFCSLIKSSLVAVWRSDFDNHFHHVLRAAILFQCDLVGQC
jgi:hypothetical protein